MEEKYILSSDENGKKQDYFIERVIFHRDKYFFSIINMSDGMLLFGEYNGQLPENEDEARDVIWKDFISGCRHISYPDGYIVDELYDLMDDGF